MAHLIPEPMLQIFAVQLQVMPAEKCALAFSQVLGELLDSLPEQSRLLTRERLISSLADPDWPKSMWETK